MEKNEKSAVAKWDIYICEKSSRASKKKNFVLSTKCGDGFWILDSGLTASGSGFFLCFAFLLFC